jgi:hypothetical protein
MKWMLIILYIYQMGPGHFTPDFHGLAVTYYDLQLECERARHGYLETDMLGSDKRLANYNAFPVQPLSDHVKSQLCSSLY